MELTQQEILLASRENLQKALPLLQNLTRKTELILEELASISTGDNDGFTSLQGRTVEPIKQSFSTLFHLYWTLTNPKLLLNGCTEFDVLTSEAYHEYFSIFEVKVAVQNNWILTKLPLLFSRYSRANFFKNGGKNKPAFTDFGYWFDRELNAALYKKNSEIPHYIEKHFSYLHVVPGDTQFPTDADNYDEKHVTDIISNHMLCTDGADFTSFSSMSIRDEILETGTYVIVSPTFGNPPSLDTLVKQIQMAKLSSKK